MENLAKSSAGPLMMTRRFSGTGSTTEAARPFVMEAIQALGHKSGFNVSDVSTFLCQRYGFTLGDGSIIKSIFNQSLKDGLLILNQEGRYKVAAKKGKKASAKPAGGAKKKSAKKSKKASKKAKGKGNGNGNGGKKAKGGKKKSAGKKSKSKKKKGAAAPAAAGGD